MARPDLSDFAKRLRAVRIAHGEMTGRRSFTQADFAHDLGLSLDRYSKYEQGLNMPPLEFLQRVRRVTGISLDYLVCGTRNGFDGMGMRDGDLAITIGDRLTWARETQSPWLEVTAQVMGVTPLQWQRWEENIQTIPIDKANEFCQRFSVTMEFLTSGALDGIDPKVLRELLRAHPELRTPTAQSSKAIDAPLTDKSKVTSANRTRRSMTNRAQSGSRPRAT
jgi:transcriptional regulator with XRE-family HTH domain